MPRAKADPFADLSQAEQIRLEKLYSGLREKLLDLTKRNRMLNYSLGGRSKRHLQIVDEVPEQIYKLLVDDGTSLETVAIPDPPDIPADEKTEEFLSELEHAKISDLEYLTALQALESTGRDDDHALLAAERKLRERLRAKLGMPPRPKRSEINRNDHAREHNVDPSLELPNKATKKSHSDKKIQTLKFPDELEAVLEKISDDARLAEQEMGLSTLFLSFGFLEWYESDTSDKRYFAPLLLLPVKLESKKAQGKKLFAISANAGSVESNLSLQKYLERDFGRLLPDFEPEDEDSSGSIDEYLAAVRKTIDGLKRWRVCRWLVLGHFAFGRLAMYADLGPENWKQHPCGHTLLQSVLKGTEAGERSALPSSPDDYSIDDPDLEKVAPYLIHDADASQHSALIDVAKGNSLVVQGPPGTGKSQTITNIIANSLALGKRILFLSEKQAALEVVKRRLDQAGLGEFCLEIHSDKSSSKQVLTNLSKRIELGFSRRGRAAQGADQTWAESRKTISEYLRALHNEQDDGRTPFDLIWGSIRGRSMHADVWAAFRNLELPPSLLKDVGQIPTALGQLEIFANAADAFASVYGHPAQSVWAKLNIGSLAAYEIDDFIDLLEQAHVAATQIVSTALHSEGLFSPALTECVRIAKEAPTLGPPPNDQALACTLPLSLPDLERAIDLVLGRRRLAAELVSKHDLSAYPTEVLGRAAKMVSEGIHPDLLRLEPGQLAGVVSKRTADLESIQGALLGMVPAIEAIGLDQTSRIGSIEAVARAITLMTQLEPSERAWFARVRGLRYQTLEPILQTWIRLRGAEKRWRSRVGGLRRPWPPATDIAAAARTLGKGAIGTFVAKVAGRVKAAKKLAAELGFEDRTPPSSQELEALGKHVHAVHAFELNSEARSLLGDGWAALGTPFNEIAAAVKCRDLLIKELADTADGEAIVEKILKLNADRLDQLVMHSKAAMSFTALPERLAAGIAQAELANLLPLLEREIETHRRILSLDQDNRLSSINVPLEQIASIADLRAKKDQCDRDLAACPLAHTAEVLCSDYASLSATQAAIEWIKLVRNLDLPQAIKDRLLGPTAATTHAQLAGVAREIAEPVGTYRQSIEQLRSGFRFEVNDEAGLEAVSLQLATLIGRREELAGFIGLLAQRKNLEELGLGDFLSRADANGIPPARLPELLLQLLTHARAARVQRSHTPLAQNTGSLLDARRAAFAERDKKKLKADRDAVRSMLLPANPPAGNNSGPRKTWTEMALIRNELTKQQRFIPIRSLIARARNSLQALTPCFMMSPLSLAKFLPAGSIEFDIAIIDEASQMRPEDALGGLLRARQIVVVGDPKQLPPTDFFNRTDAADMSSDDEVEYDDVDDESILEACQKAFRLVRRLKWHYRSRCESLIAFSNREFYDNSLITFPMARPGSFSIDLIHVNGPYQGRQNVMEASRVAEEAISFMRHHATFDEDKLPSLGIVAVNVEQRDLIRSEVARLSHDDDLVDQYQEKAAKKGEPFFVKNLENVQGDERDFILISMTYGREPGATALKQRFGPINGKQGHRRLNVLFSRARQRIGLFTSFGPTDVKPTERSHLGVHVLQRYLEYTEGRGRAAVEAIAADVDSDFEAEVADRLRAKGYGIEYQVGVSGYRIDLGVRHPDRPDVFLAGIECDGARYHSSKSARDRDRLREEVLGGLGWKIVRIWSTDWFLNPGGETQKLLLKLDKLRQESQTHTASDAFAFATDIGPDGEEPSGIATATLVPDVAGTGSESPAAVETVLAGEAQPTLQKIARRSPNSVAQALKEFRESVIAKEMMDWEPERSILRDGMIETFVTMRITDPDAWFGRIPQYQRQNTNPLEKKRYLERICEIVSQGERLL